MLDADIKERLNKLNYPCYIVLYGPERDYRTKYRHEHGGYFHSSMVYNIDEAVNMFENIRYSGTYREMEMIAIYHTMTLNSECELVEVSI